MDPHSAKLVRDAILELRGEQRAIIVCTHNLAEAELLADHIAIIRQGRIIAQDNPDTLKRQLLGRRHFILHLDHSPNGLLAEEIKELVIVESIEGPFLRYVTDDPMKKNPQLVRRLDALGLGVIALSEVSASLEDVYLSLVLEDNKALPAADQPEPDESEEA
jgi:ABC-2 type transport system ATP-binding protein